MPNTSLPTSVTAGSTGHVAHSNAVHAEVNRMTRDTGWRVIPLINGWTATYARIRRVDDRVTIRVRNLDGTAASAPFWGQFAGTDNGSSISTGYRGLNGLRSPLHELGNGDDGYFAQPTNNYLYADPAASFSGDYAYEWTFITDALWPSYEGQAI